MCASYTKNQPCRPCSNAKLQVSLLYRRTLVQYSIRVSPEIQYIFQDMAYCSPHGHIRVAVYPSLQAIVPAMNLLLRERKVRVVTGVFLYNSCYKRCALLLAADTIPRTLLYQQRTFSPQLANCTVFFQTRYMFIPFEECVAPA